MLLAKDLTAIASSDLVTAFSPSPPVAAHDAADQGMSDAAAILAGRP
ncbi:hypothetical protein [Pseudonocardia sp. GCM10023141]